MALLTLVPSVLLTVRFLFSRDEFAEYAEARESALLPHWFSSVLLTMKFLFSRDEFAEYAEAREFALLPYWSSSVSSASSLVKKYELRSR